MKAALFDLDGTLINTERRSLAMWALMLAENGVPVDDALLRGFMGRRGRDVLAEHPELFPGRSAEEIFDEMLTYEEHPDLPEIVPVPGAAELVRRVAAYGTPVAVVTSAMRWWAESRLRDVGVRELVRTIVSAEDVEVGKPDPAAFLLGASRLGADPAHCVAFEDSVAGVAAAKAAGMTCVGVATTHAGADLALADVVVADLTAVDWPPDDVIGRGSGLDHP